MYITILHLQLFFVLSRLWGLIHLLVSSLLLQTNSSIRPSNLSQNLSLLLFRRRLKGIFSYIPNAIVCFLYLCCVCMYHVFFCTRLDEKDPPYDLIYEDDELLSGKVRKCVYSFFLINLSSLFIMMMLIFLSVLCVSSFPVLLSARICRCK